MGSNPTLSAALGRGLAKISAMLELRTILAPTDFSPTSEEAVDYAVSFAARFNASVAIVHAYEIPIYGIPDGAFVATPEMVGRIQAAGQAALDAAVARRQGRGVALQGYLYEGRAWEVIHETATKVGADIIVIGTHGRRGLARALLGSVAEKVIRTATLPVLTVHSSQPAKQQA